LEEIDLKQIFKILLERKFFIIITTILLLALGYFYTKFYLVPRYQTYSTMLLTQVDKAGTTSIVGSDNNTDQAITPGDVSLNTSLIGTYRDLITSRNALTQVVDNLGLKNISVNSLASSITVTASNSLLKISVSNTDPVLAAEIANEIPNVFNKMIVDIYKIQNVKVIDTAEVSYSPYNISLMRNLAMFGAAGFILSIMIVMLVFYLDNTIKNSDDIENYIGLNVRPYWI